MDVAPHLVHLAEALDLRPASLTAPDPVDLPVGDLTVRYYDWGGTSSRIVVLVHGGGLTARTWDLVALGLRGEYRCIAVDLRGHGETSWPEDADYRLESYAADLDRLLAEFGCENCVLVGMSLGGQTTLLAASTRPELRGLVLVDVGPEPEIAGSDKIIQFVSVGAEFADLDSAVDSALAFNPRRDPAILRSSLLNNLRELPDGRWTWKYDSRAFTQLRTGDLRQARARLLWAAVDRVRCPVLVLRGGDSDVFSDAQAQELCDRLPDARWRVVPAAGHTVQGDNPRGTLEALRPFLDSCW